MGRTECNRIVNFQGRADGWSGRWSTSTITEALPHSLRGELLGCASRAA